MGIVVGLTGGIATGKSTVSAIFKRLGAYIIDADEQAKKAVRKGTSAWKEIRDFFGVGILNRNGTINRRKLGRIIFEDKSKKKRLEEIIHPRVFKEIEMLKKAIIRKDRDAIILCDIPLLIESDYHRKVDKLILVYSGKREQLARLTKKFSYEDALRRIKSQMSLNKKKRYADYIIDNSGSIKETETQCRKIYAELASASHEKSP
ncbi:MAG: dephospho-CoA kinase [Nitrospirae bacterium]|nr:dephospho-CoA kinase [Nitrospirota bacterium]